MYNKLKNIVPHKIKVDNYSARLLEKQDIKIVQKFFENNEDFFIMGNGSSPKKNEAEELLNLLPEGKDSNDKFWIGLFDLNNLIAFVDIIQNYKNENEWSIEVFMVDKNYRNKSIATKLFNQLENLLISLKVNSLLTVVQEQNNCSLCFWGKVGFINTEKRKQKHFTEKEEFLMAKKLEKKEPTILEKCFKNGKLVFISSKSEERKEIYKAMQLWFEKDKKYTELEINSILKSNIETSDHVTLRRDMVDSGFLNRSGDGKQYWV